MKFGRLRNGLFVSSPILLILGCVIPVPPPALPVAAPPLVTGQGCLVTVVKESQSVGGAIKFVYVTLDDVGVARLESGQYTNFWVEPGHHTIGVRWRIGDLLIISPWGIGGTSRKPPEFSKAVELECRPGEKYFYGNRLKWFSWSDVDRMEFRQLTDLGEDFQLEGKTFVYAGMPE